MKIGQKLAPFVVLLAKLLAARHFWSYKRILEYARQRDDIWIASQGTYLLWWNKRADATFSVTVSEGQVRVSTSLEGAVIEKYPEAFLDLPVVSCPDATYSGQVWITIDSALEKKELLIELLKREGILNYRIAERGEFMLSERNVGPLLDRIDADLQRGRGFMTEASVRAVRQIVVDELALRNLPLVRVWYHPRIRNTVIRAVFSPRLDVDRAITNLARIRGLEQRYGAESTLYVRAFCPFYADNDIQELASKPWCSEIALHGEFVTHAERYGDELAAAKAEKAHLERLIGRPVVGVGLHGGELAFNKSAHSQDAIQAAGLLYDTTLGPVQYYFPFKKITDGRVSEHYVLPHAISDVSISSFKPVRGVVDGQVTKSYRLSSILNPANLSSIPGYKRLFYEKTADKIDEVYDQNGVLVLIIHPWYFGVFSYLFRPRNLVMLAKFVKGYFSRSLG